MAKKLLKVYKIFARSRDGQGYECELCCDPENIQTSLDKHMTNKGWNQYGYKVVTATEPESIHIEVDFNEFPAN